MFFPTWKMKAAHAMIDAQFDGESVTWDRLVRAWVDAQKTFIYKQIDRRGLEAYEEHIEHLVILEYMDEILIYAHRDIRLINMFNLFDYTDTISLKVGEPEGEDKQDGDGYRENYEEE